MENERMIIRYVLDWLSEDRPDDITVTLELALKLIDGLGYYDAEKALKIIFGAEGGAKE